MSAATKRIKKKQELKLWRARVARDIFVRDSKAREITVRRVVSSALARLGGVV